MRVTNFGTLRFVKAISADNAVISVRKAVLSKRLCLPCLWFRSVLCYDGVVFYRLPYPVEGICDRGLLRLGKVHEATEIGLKNFIGSRAFGISFIHTPIVRQCASIWRRLGLDIDWPLPIHGDFC